MSKLKFKIGDRVVVKNKNSNYIGKPGKIVDIIDCNNSKSWSYTSSYIVELEMRSRPRVEFTGREIDFIADNKTDNTMSIPIDSAFRNRFSQAFTQLEESVTESIKENNESPPKTSIVAENIEWNDFCKQANKDWQKFIN